MDGRALAESCLAGALSREMDTLPIRYRFTLLNGRQEVFELAIDRRTLELQVAPPPQPEVTVGDIENRLEELLTIVGLAVLSNV